MTMRKFFQLVTALLFAAVFVPATLIVSQPPKRADKKDKSQHENVEWIWQYTPSDKDKNGRENDLIQDPHFKPFLEQYLTTPQTFWGIPIEGRYRTLANTALDHLSVPDRVLADDNRYVAITGCVFHFCPARGLLWIDLNGSHHLVVFAAIDWSKQGRPTSDPDAEYTLWIFPNDRLTTEEGGQHPPAALTKAITRWAAQPLAGSGVVQNITHAILVDPDGTPHEIPPSAIGIGATPKVNPDAETPVLKPRN